MNISARLKIWVSINFLFPLFRFHRFDVWFFPLRIWNYQGSGKVGILRVFTFLGWPFLQESCTNMCNLLQQHFPATFIFENIRGKNVSNFVFGGNFNKIFINQLKIPFSTSYMIIARKCCYNKLPLFVQFSCRNGQP